jgi:hypothetical protein
MSFITTKGRNTMTKPKLTNKTVLVTFVGDFVLLFVDGDVALFVGGDVTHFVDGDVALFVYLCNCLLFSLCLWIVLQELLGLNITDSLN